MKTLLFVSIAGFALWMILKKKGPGVGAAAQTPQDVLPPSVPTVDYGAFGASDSGLTAFPAPMTGA